jgi:arsenite methyltransferase
MNSTEVYRAVQERYSAASKGTSDDTYASTVAASFGYSKADLESIPKDANLGLSCGNPLVIAGLREAGFRTMSR